MKQEKEPIPKLKRAISMAELALTKFDVIPMQGKFKDLIGQPEKTGVIIIWGDSGEGKTEFALQLADELAQYGRVLYNSIEEGVSESLKGSIARIGLIHRKNVLLLDKEPMNDLAIRLEKRRSADFVFLDSWQYMQMLPLNFKNFTNHLRHKLFIVLSHANGKLPKGSGDTIRYDAFVKIRIEGYKAFAQSRYGGNGKPYVIWDKGAYEYWGG
jgi:hypothetical protein